MLLCAKRKAKEDKTMEKNAEREIESADNGVLVGYFVLLCLGSKVQVEENEWRCRG